MFIIHGVYYTSFHMSHVLFLQFNLKIYPRKGKNAKKGTKNGKMQKNTRKIKCILNKCQFFFYEIFTFSAIVLKNWYYIFNYLGHFQINSGKITYKISLKSLYL